MLNSQVDEIKSRLSIEEVVSEYIQTQRAGRNLKARCPFHNEKTPSFMISPERQMWHCFGCGEGGDIFTFIMKIEGLEFVEALKMLAQKAGVKIEKSNYNSTGNKNQIFEIVEMSRKFYQECLKIKNGIKAYEYLISRGISNEIIEKFQLGYSPDSWDILSKFLKKKKYKESDIFLSGMTVKKNRGGYYDRFRGRIMFPINNISGQTVGFSSRVMPGEDESRAKYINTSETVIYNKGRVLYGLDKSKISIRQNDLCIIVEGNMDVIASFQAGVENVVATSGTAMTVDQIKIIKRYTKNIAFSFDADDAGIKAADRGIEIALAEGMNVSVISIPQGKDPADCVKNNPKLWVDAVQNQKPIMDFYFNSAFSKYNNNDINGKKKIAEDILRIIQRISNKIEQSYYLKMLSEKLEIDEETINETLREMKIDKTGIQNQKIESKFKKPKTTTVEIQLQKKILGFIILYPHFFEELFLDLEEFFSDDKIKVLYKMIHNLYKKNGKINNKIITELQEKISLHKNYENEKESLIYLWNIGILAAEDKLEEIVDVQNEARICVNNLKKINLQKKLKDFEIKINIAAKNGNQQQQQAFIEEMNKCNLQLNELDLL